MRALFVLPLLVSSVAYADGVSFDVSDHGDSVEVIAHNVTARSTQVSSIRSRLEVPLAGNPIANKQLMGDSTVLQVELDGISARVLSVKTRLDRPEVHALAPLAKAEQIGNDLHLTFPRHANIAMAAKPAATEIKAEDIKIDAKPTIADAIKTEIKPEAKPEPKPAPKPEAAKLDAQPDATKTTTAAAAATPTPPAPPTKSEKLTPSNDASNNIVMYGAAGILALLGGAYILRKRKRETTATSTIDVVAQRALGNKAKVMWLAAGSREILVAVTNQNVRMLGQWPRTQENAAPLPTARLSFADLDAAPAIPASSPSVAGIMKLRRGSQPVIGRAQTQPSIGRASTHSGLARMPKINEDVATEDPDADMVWAKELLAATGGRR